jgi:hypothetical protein
VLAGDKASVDENGQLADHAQVHCLLQNLLAARAHVHGPVESGYGVWSCGRPFPGVRVVLTGGCGCRRLEAGRGSAAEAF